MCNKKNYFYRVSILIFVLLMASRCSPSGPDTKQSKLSTLPFTQEVVNVNKEARSQLTAGISYTLAITKSGVLYAWGKNYKGQLGLGDKNDRNTPILVKVKDVTKWQSVAAGSDHTLAITKSGALYAWGRNNEGQLGLGDKNDRNTPILVKVKDVSKWQNVASGNAYGRNLHVIAITKSGALYAWGKNYKGQLGLENTDRQTTPQQVNNEIHWKHVSAGNYYTLALTDTGALYAWGNNENEELGLGDSGENTNRERSTLVTVDGVTKWQSVYAGGHHTLALTDTGKLYAWGQNNAGQLGLGDTTDKNEPTLVTVDGVSKWNTVTMVNTHTLAFTDTGVLYAWGRNDYGQLGLVDDITNKNKPTAVLIHLPQ